MPSYNMKNRLGESAVFWTFSTRILEELLACDDLEVTAADGRPLLWRCAENRLVTERVATDAKLASQYGQRWEGTLPFEKGESFANV